MDSLSAMPNFFPLASPREVRFGFRGLGPILKMFTFPIFMEYDLPSDRWLCLLRKRGRVLGNSTETQPRFKQRIAERLVPYRSAREVVFSCTNVCVTEVLYSCRSRFCVFEHMWKVLDLLLS